MPRQSTDPVAVFGIDIDKSTSRLVGLNRRGAIILRRKLSRGQLQAKLANLPPSASPAWRPASAPTT